MIFNVQPQTDGYFCLWQPADSVRGLIIQAREHSGESWRQLIPRQTGRAFVPASRGATLRLADSAGHPLSQEVHCDLMRERIQDRLPARVPFSKMRRFHSWRRFRDYAASRARNRVSTLDGAVVFPDPETANGLYLVAGAPTLFSRAVGRRLLNHPTHAPDVIRDAARRMLWRTSLTIERVAGLIPEGAAELGSVAPEMWIVQAAPGLYSRIARLRPRRPHGGVAIYHEGHTGAGLRAGCETVGMLLERGWQVCCVDMLLCGDNFVDRGGRFPDHNSMWLLNPADACAPLAAMVAPLRALVDQLQQEGIAGPVILGRSGGGMMAYLYAALDERVQGCVSLAGGVPLSQRLEFRSTDLGDYEQFAPEFFDLVRHEDLMMCAAQRGLLLIYNRYDSDCFSLPADHALQSYLQREAARHGREVRWFVDETHRAHSFSPAGYLKVERFLEDLRLGAFK